MNDSMRPALTDGGNSAGGLAMREAGYLPMMPGGGGGGMGPAMSMGGGAGSNPALDLIKLWWRRKTLILMVTLLFMTLGVLYLIYATPLYTGYSRLAIEYHEPVIMADNRGLPPRTKSYLYTQCEVITSTPVLTRALQMPGVRDCRTLKEAADPLDFLSKNVDAEVGKKDDLVEVMLNTPYPQDSSLIVNAVVNAYIQFQNGAKKSTGVEMAKVLDRERKDVEQQLAAKNRELLDFKAKNGELSYQDGRGNIIVQKLSDLSTALTKAHLESIAAEGNYKGAVALQNDPEGLKHWIERSVGGSTGYMAGADREIEELKLQLTQLEVRLALMKRQFVTNHPQVLQAQAACEDLRGKLNDRYKIWVASYLASAKQTWETTKQAEEGIKKALDDQQQAAAKLNETTAHYMLLDSEAKRLEKIADSLDTQANMNRVNSGAGGMDITVLESGETSDFPSKPNRMLVMAATVFLGLMFGSGAALLRGFTDQRLSSSEDIKATLGTPVLCAIPFMRGAGSPITRGQMVYLDPTSQASEAYRAVRTAVDYHMSRSNSRTLLVTSPSQGDGKSTLVSNLAIAMAQAGMRTLVIDADLRRPSVNMIFQATGGPGLSAVLSGTATPEGAINGTTIDGLDLLPSGALPRNPAELLSSRALSDLLRKLAERYDRIIIDSPPVMPLADARSVAVVCDRTLLVLRSERTSRKSGEDACAALASVGAKLMGVIINGVHKSTGFEGRYYGGGNGYRSRLPDHTMRSNGNGQAKHEESLSSAGPAGKAS